MQTLKDNLNLLLISPLANLVLSYFCSPSVGIQNNFHSASVNFNGAYTILEDDYEVITFAQPLRFPSTGFDLWFRIKGELTTSAHITCNRESGIVWLIYKAYHPPKEKLFIDPRRLEAVCL